MFFFAFLVTMQRPLSLDWWDYGTSTLTVVARNGLGWQKKNKDFNRQVETYFRPVFGPFWACFMTKIAHFPTHGIYGNSLMTQKSFWHYVWFLRVEKQNLACGCFSWLSGKTESWPLLVLEKIFRASGKGQSCRKIPPKRRIAPWWNNKIDLDLPKIGCSAWFFDFLFVTAGICVTDDAMLNFEYFYLTASWILNVWFVVVGSRHQGMQAKRRDGRTGDAECYWLVIEQLEQLSIPHPLE